MRPLHLVAALAACALLLAWVVVVRLAEAALARRSRRDYLARHGQLSFDFGPRARRGVR